MVDIFCLNNLGNLLLVAFGGGLTKMVHVCDGKSLKIVLFEGDYVKKPVDLILHCFV